MLVFPGDGKSTTTFGTFFEESSCWLQNGTSNEISATMNHFI